MRADARRARLRYLWCAMPTEGIELLSAALSGTFAILLLKAGANANAIEHAYAFAALCLTASACKVVGVVFERTALRIVGLLLGNIFWVTLSGVIVVTVPGSITWLCFAILALAQLWAVWRLVRDA